MTKKIFLSEIYMYLSLSTRNILSSPAHLI